MVPSLLLLSIVGVSFELPARVAHAQLLGQHNSTADLKFFAQTGREPSTRWAGGIDRGGNIKCRIGNSGGTCKSPENCIFNLSAREEQIRTSLCMHERMERPYIGRYVDARAKGVYTCSCCNRTLFHSSAQFHSGHGYLAFWSQSDIANVGYKHHEGSWLQHPLDTGLHCENCGAHIGNIREDGPHVSGRRYYVNSECVKLYCELPDCAADKSQVAHNEKIAKTWRAFDAGNDHFELRVRRVIIGSSFLSCLGLLVLACVYCCRKPSQPRIRYRRVPGQFP